MARPNRSKAAVPLALFPAREQVRLARLRARQAARTRNKLAQKESRWVRFAHYVWDKPRKGRP